MSDPIRAALEAAQKEASSFYDLSETAQIIEAFLRHRARELALTAPVAASVLYLEAAAVEAEIDGARWEGGDD